MLLHPVMLKFDVSNYRTDVAQLLGKVKEMNLQN